MEYRKLGQSGLSVSAIGFGSWLTIGNRVDDVTTERLVQTAFDRGVNLFDTADVYARGDGERSLSRGIAGLVRHELVLASKCYFPMSDDVNDRGLSRKHVFESLHRSLRRLQTDYLDLYQCHRPDPNTPVDETCMAMDDLIRQGKVLYWGVSMWPAWLIARTVEMCRRNGWHAPVSNQPVYNLLDRHIEQEVVPAGEALGVGQLVYSPLAQGVLTGKYRPDASLPAGSRAADPEQGKFVERYLDRDQLGRVQRFAERATRLGTTPARLALRWAMDQPGIASVLIGTRTLEQLEDNLGALEVTIPVDLAEEIEELFPGPE
jgi:aryl-alcohol dehydrogenase-like predicted oxidoreductase